MKLVLETLAAKFEKGEISRRTFVGDLSALFATLAGVSIGSPSSVKAQTSSLFRVSEINHIAIRVSDLDRSQEFYEEILGMRMIFGRSTFRMMGCGPHFVALFKSTDIGLDHLAFTLPSYNQGQAVKKLKEIGIEPALEEERTYFRDPDGYLIQIEHPQAWPAAGKRPKAE